MVGMLAAACASKNNPPPASSAEAAEASSYPNTDSASAPLTNDTQTAADTSSTENASTGSTERDSTASNSATSATASSGSSAATTSTAPDNTRVNTRDKKDKTLTPTDQGSSEDDRKITQQIRQAVVKNGSLSFTAKNVKIITNDGKVTLRGPVKTDAERTAIEAAAKNVAGVTQVDNQLEVKK